MTLDWLNNHDVGLVDRASQRTGEKEHKSRKPYGTPTPSRFFLQGSQFFFGAFGAKNFFSCCGPAQPWMFILVCVCYVCYVVGGILQLLVHTPPVRRTRRVAGSNLGNIQRGGWRVKSCKMCGGVFSARYGP